MNDVLTEEIHPERPVEEVSVHLAESFQVGAGDRVDSKGQPADRCVRQAINPDLSLPPSA